MRRFQELDIPLSFKDRFAVFELYFQNVGVSVRVI